MITPQTKQDATTFPTNECDWPTKVNKVQKILVRAPPKHVTYVVLEHIL